MALGIIIEKIRMDEIVDKLFNKKLTGITWLTELNVGKILLVQKKQISVYLFMPIGRSSLDSFL